MMIGMGIIWLLTIAAHVCVMLALLEHLRQPPR